MSCNYTHGARTTGATTAVIVSGDITLKEETYTLPTITFTTLVKLEPSIVIVVPKPPVVGEKEEIVGGGR